MATIAYDTRLYIGDGVSASLTSVPALLSITCPDAEQQIVEATHLGSSGRIREYLSGMVEPGSWSFSARWSKTTYDRLMDLKGLVKSYQIEFPDTSTAAFSSILTKTSCEVSGPDAVLDVKAEGKVSGAVTFTPAS